MGWKVGTTATPARHLLLLVANTIGIVALAGAGLLVLLLSTADGGTGAPAVTRAEPPAATSEPTRYVPFPLGRSIPHWDPENGWLSEFATSDQVQYGGR
ncbi:MAG: hypothetical protein WD557_18835 [Dehalococcoidia bacterium]